MCGLRKRSNYPDFFEKFENFDIVCFLEAKIDTTDIIPFPGFTAFQQPRKQTFIRRSGGIIVYVKDDLAKYVTKIETESDYVMWLTLDKSLFHSNENYILGAVYIPPESSSYYNDDEMLQLDSEITSFCSSNEFVMLTGDFNSRTSSYPDYIEIDDFLTEMFDFDSETTEFFSHINKLECLNILKNRCSQDRHVNNNGNKLLNLCKNNNLFIANGRIGQDKSVGKFTFKTVSVIDYTIATASMFKHLLNFDVIELDPLFSDGHCLLQTTLKRAQVYKQQPNIQNNDCHIPRWNCKFSDSFASNINLQAVDDILALLRSNNCSRETINTATDMISKVFQASRCMSFPKKRIPFKGNNANSKNKPWFGSQCKNARRKYHLAKRRYYKTRDLQDKTYLTSLSKEYKRTMDKFISQYRKKNESKLRKMQSSKPKEYWKLLNSLNTRSNKNTPNLEEFVEHFKNLNKSQREDTDFNLGSFDPANDNEMLNSKITRDEILRNINKLKNGKAAGYDSIANEYIKHTKDIFLPVYEILFNTILDTGNFPEQWTLGIIKPVYKNKGNSNDVNNFRPITILSCLGKLFTSILNDRLSIYLEESMLLLENQAGFRKEYSTLDHIFSLNAVIEILKHHKKKLFCCFVDFSSAFDSVWRVGLWQKLLNMQIEGKVLRVIYNMYYDIKSCVSLNGENSTFFASACGVRQGENLSPVLFSIYLNDLESFLDRTDLGMQFGCFNNELAVYFRMIVLLYADDTVVLADSAIALQNYLDRFHEYCTTWKLAININKTKVVVFGARKTDNMEFRLGNKTIEIVDKYKYLGVFFSRSRSFLNCRKHVVEQARKAMHLLFCRINNLHLPVDLQLQLFDNTIVPILTYACEIWGFECLDLIENVHTDFLRKITKSRKSTPLYMLYAELGRIPLEVTIKTRIIGFWNKLISG